jgi:hypothetical protein
MEEYKQAKHVLGLETDRFTAAELKRAYIKRAIVCHPDKNKGTDESTMKFQELQASYSFLSTFVLQEGRDPEKEEEEEEGVAVNEKKQTNNNNNNNNLSKENDDGEELLAFTKEVLQGKYQQVLLDLVCGIKTISISALEKISKHQLQKVYDFLLRYGCSLFIPEDMIQVVKDILEKKETMEEIYYTVSPTLNDLMGDKLYKLTLEDKTYLVPLWHTEVWFDGKKEGQDIIVSCNPTLPENIRIDTENHLYVTIRISLNSSLLNEAYVISLGKKTFTLPVNQLHVTADPQTICLPNCGILKINEDNFYDVSKRSNIYFVVQFI